MNKTVVALLCLTISFAAARAQDTKTNPPAPAVPAQPQAAPQVPAKPDPDAGKFKFEEETHDYGEVVEGPTAEYDFVFKNVGKSPIIISEAHGSCGCTVPKWPKEPILPKHKGTIHVTYNTAGRVGPINKDVYITSNAQQNPMKLHITGYVKPKPAPVEGAKPVQVPAPPPPPAPTK